ncbi:MAG: formylglycine-generating enzyme family protein, partial [Acidobacteria bacterium]|nr:formylglycine-generating enzyme family protein [Acidobacteriota bacterium]
VKLKRTRGEKSNPFELLHEVSYTNDSDYPEVDLNGIKFVFIKGGEFENGYFKKGDMAFFNDAPQLSKSLGSFWISKTEITISQYYKEPATANEQWNLPKNDINLEGASSFARGFGKQYELISNLPTEAQWGYAARSGGEKMHAKSKDSRGVYTGFRIVLESDKQ